MNLPGFVEQKVLGKGTYGCVYKAQRIQDGKSYAVKVVNLGALTRREVEDAVNEIRLMASFQSPFLVHFYEAFCDNRRLFIVSEYARLGDLAHLIERRKRKNRPLHEDDIWRYLIQILEGLRLLHSSGVVHRDIKSANILLAAPDLCKIGDLGISTVLHNTQLAKTQIGTPLYIAPEVWKNRPYDSKCDIWSLGVLLYEMMTFSFPFIGRTTNDLARRVIAGNFQLPSGYSSDLQFVLRRMLQTNHVLRPSADELLNMSCFQSRMGLIKTVASSMNSEEEHLLRTIKVPLNIRDVNLPSANYHANDGILPLDQRLHLKPGVAVRKDISMCSSPDLMMISDLDLWTPGPVIAASTDGDLRINSDRPMYKPVPPPTALEHAVLPPRPPPVPVRVPLEPLPPVPQPNPWQGFYPVAEPMQAKPIQPPIEPNYGRDPRWRMAPRKHPVGVGIDPKKWRPVYR